MRPQAPLVEFLWWRGCPSHELALAELREAIASTGLDPEAIVVREVEDEAAAECERFAGSPTIRIDGEDIQPGEPPGLSCRVYRLRDGRPSPTPDPADVREAIEKATRKGDPRWRTRQQTASR